MSDSNIVSDDQSGKENTLDASKKPKLNKNQKKKLRKKLKNQNKQVVEDTKPQDEESDEDVKVEVEYVPDDSVKEELESDPALKSFVKVFEKFRTGDRSRLDDDWKPSSEVDYRKKLLERKKPVELDLKDEAEDDEDGEKKISKRKLKEMTRMSVADLKTKVSHPELVEMHDVTAKDPIILLTMKSTRNTVPVPRHWCFKRKYLQGKRGFEKPPFKLPEFIRRTGIMEMRESVQEKEDTKTLKTKMREKMRPKMGKIDIDYQKLHDAFFKWQTKPPMTIHGDLYYEGKEFETVLKNKKPGDLSSELRIALGMPTGPNAHKIPPPWLIAMQRYGPPPSYPSQKIAGLNAPIPDGCSFGYHAGGWGKPPVDEYGRPLYGDVFGISQAKELYPADEEVDRTLWGQILEDEEEEEDDDEEEEEEEDENAEKSAANASKSQSKQPGIDSGIATPAGIATPGGFSSSIPAGLETPGVIELRKRKIEAEMESNYNPQLYSVLPEKRVDRFGNQMMGSTHVYDVSASKIPRRGEEGVMDMALDPSDMDLAPSEMNSKIEQRIQDSRAHLVKESSDLSDMVSRHISDTKKKAKGADDASKKKKLKDFKF